MPPHPTSWRSILILSFHLSLGLPSGLFPSSFLTKTLYTPLIYPTRDLCPAHLIHHCLVTRVIFGGQYRLLSSSLCSFLHYPVTSSLLGTNILLSTLFSEFRIGFSLNVSDQAVKVIYGGEIQRCSFLTLILLMWRIWWAPNNASKWKMGFNSEFKGLI